KSTEATMQSKDDEARILAEDHYQVEPGMLQIFRLVGNPETESRPDEPIKLLEVNEATIPTGIMPLKIDAIAAWGLRFPIIIVQITPEEFEQLQKRQLQLPNGWAIGELIPKPVETGAA